MRAPRNKSAGSQHRRMINNTASRPGATLTEVLMSLLIMGLGITSVFTLFPMSIIRSVKATQQTHATLVAQNARELIHSQLIFRTRNGAIDPPTFNYPLNVTTKTHYKGTYFVDPYGRALGLSSNIAGLGGGRRRRGLSGSLTAKQLDTLLAGRDSWIRVAEAVPNSVNATSIVFEADVDLSGIGANSRVVLYSNDRSRSITRRVSTVGAQVVNLAAGERIPNQYRSGDFSDARLETYERRYTWQLQIDGDGRGGYKSLCIVSFRRDFSPASEEAFRVTQVRSSDRRRVIVDLSDSTATPPSEPTIKVGNWVFATHWTTEVDGAGNKIPFGWGWWYRILYVKELNGNQVELTLDQAWRGPTQSSGGNYEPVDDPTMPARRSRMMFPRGIVEVYEL